MTRFLYPELRGLPKPQLIDEISADKIIDEIKVTVRARWEAVRAERPDLPSLDFLDLETEPLTILIEAFAYRETLLRALVNDKARAVLLAFATGTDLDHIGALVGVERAVIVPGGDAGPAILEDHDRYRRRIQLAPEAFSVAGPQGAYEFHALTVDPSIMDAYAYSTAPGEVRVAVVGAGVAPVSDAVLTKLVRLFLKGDVVPLTDSVTVRRATIVDVDVTVNVQAGVGSDALAVRSGVETAIRSYMATRARIGVPVYVSGLIAAAKTVDIENVVITNPSTDVLCGQGQIARLGALAVNVSVIG